MPRKTSTIFSPPVGCRIVIIDTITNEEVIMSTLSVRDHTSFKHRTPKGHKGQEYFYVKYKIKGEWNYVKMLNSIHLDKCKSEEGRFVFEGKLPNGRYLPSRFEKNKKIDKPIKSVRVEVSPESFSYFNEELVNA